MSYNFHESIQRSIIYLSKSHRDDFVQIKGLIKPDYFEYPIHSKLFDIISNYFEEYKELPTDAILQEECKKLKDVNDRLSDYVDEIEQVNSLSLESLKHKDYYLDKIEEFAKKEALKAAIAESVQLIKEGNVNSIEDVIRSALRVSRVVDNGLVYFSGLDARWDRLYNDEKKDKFKTILTALNNSLNGGLEKKELAIVIAPAGVGKSLYLANQAVKSLMEHRKVLYVSLEMSEDRVAQRLDSMITLIPQALLQFKKDKVEERTNMFKKHFQGNIIIKEFPNGVVTANHLRALIHQLKNTDNFEPDVLIIDYLELLRPLREDAPEYLAQEYIARDLRGLAAEYKLLCWTATQTNRQGATTEIITDAHLADSYGKIRVADFAVSLNQTQEEFDNGQIRVFVVKNRNGRGKFLTPMSIDYNTLTMRDPGKEQEEAEESSSEQS